MRQCFCVSPPQHTIMKTPYEMPRDSEITRAIQRGLDSLEIDQSESNTVWSKAIKTELCRIGRGEFCYTAGAGGITESDRDHGEWLYDVTWLEYDGDFVTHAHLVAECEWLGGVDIDEDFQKLLLARASVRLMIFDGSYEPGAEGIADRLAKQVGKFKHSREGDTWLLAAWERTGENEKGWRFRWFTIEPGSAREL